jgi:hypothetical protein
MRFPIAWWIAALAVPCLAPGRADELPVTGIAYEIEVTLDPASRMLEGRELIRWRNPGGRDLRTVPLHLYLNGFSHEQTTWMRGVPARRLEADEFLELWPDPWGWSEPLAIRQNGADLAWRPIAPDDGNLLDRSLIEVTLAEPLPPAGQLDLEVEFSARLPIPIARTGGSDEFFLVAQWFPKIGVYEPAGTRGAVEGRWAAHQFHGPTEFYADYADYDVRIGVPAGWSVVATGRGGPEPGTSSNEIAWHRYRQRTVHDFAFSAGRRMSVVEATHQPAGTGGPVAITVFLPQGTEHQAPRWRRAAEACLDVLGSRVGPYPYDVLTVVKPPASALRTAGMEYPTLFTGGPGDPLWDLDLFSGIRLGEVVVAHECAHQYFYGLVGTNEFEEAFLDEGFTDHWGNEIMIAAFGEDAGGDILGRRLSITGIERMGLPGGSAAVPPIRFGPSYLLRGHSIGAQFYNRPAATVRTAAALFGRSVVDRVFAHYLRTWKFRHPGVEDFLAAARAAAGEEVADFFAEAFTQTRQPDYRVARLDSLPWSAPRGRLVAPDGGVDEASDPAVARSSLGLDPAAREDDGRLQIELLDPGWTLGDQHRPGRIVRRQVRPQTGEPDEAWQSREEEFHLSTVRLEGPAWQRLPVEVMFRFADGATVQESWDGRAPYRIYRFLRAAPLSEVRLDPEGKIALDPDPVNNARLRQPDRRLVDDWALWLGALFQLAGEALASWL